MDLDELLVRVVVRPVLDNDDLEVVLIGHLIEHELEATRELIDALALVVGWDDDRDQFLGIGHGRYFVTSPAMSSGMSGDMR